MSSKASDMVAALWGFETPHVIEPRGKHTHTIVFVHGRGSQGTEAAEDLFDGETAAGRSLATYAVDGTKWVFPSARSLHSVTFGEDIPQWFDIRSLSDTNVEPELQIAGLRDAIGYIRSLVVAEMAGEGGLDPSKIILAGISQGFATAVHVLLSGGHRLGGFIGLSGWLPFSDALADSVRGSTTKEEELRGFYRSNLGVKAIATTRGTLETPIFLSHARDDATVDIALGRTARRILEEALGMEVEWREYAEGGHWINAPQGHDDIARFIGARQR